tara:strand:- start:1146 stop:1394 length:249 start_codon:yes stop_codon:yes gene_type:complete
MKIFLLLCILVITSSLIGKKIFYTAKRNLFKDQEAWSGKDIKIRHSKSKKDTSELKRSNNFLEIIADESKIYLEDQTKKDEA